MDAAVRYGGKGEYVSLSPYFGKRLSHKHPPQNEEKSK